MHLGKNNQGQLLLLEWQHRKVLINTSKMYFNIADFGSKNTAFKLKHKENVQKISPLR